ncbi:mannitol-1-phosphate 5-dehydrogenase [Halolactibacillus miurensis]|uniref:Mannitol-1-phosphate 5-dehydrogenase n=1 Tax=Halolactibacillus miurensis TaxID=306541 RepID=A0A1I6Q1X6_9BACI|nr:mannitol-1-phosphate 5-dehydrogenase [Halolactibacillus miurensis]GEM03342.1 mannitol-1-phosphate 5-dehydrogenase [Halolactibacillus miurensis]SFS46467.1 mannitol-1-phosphate 5-dehydrogenase [Halolactibacillus miurensis]
MKALHFGAGNIGRGFIGYLLNQSGYDVCFVDVNQAMIDQLNQTGTYKIELLDDHQTTLTVSGVTALNSGQDKEEVIRAIKEANIITTSVGVDNLKYIVPILSEGLIERVKENDQPLDVLANENAVNASSTLKTLLSRHVGDQAMEELQGQVSFVNTAIDRLALSKEADEGMIALVEPFYEWVIHRGEMINHTLPALTGATYVDDLTPYIERKLYLVNMAHAATAYVGYLNGASTIQQALQIPDILSFIRGLMREAAAYFVEVHGVEKETQMTYIDKVLARFMNNNISDEVTRVGRSPIRKVGPDERLVKPLTALSDLDKPVNHFIKVVAAAYLFDYSGDDEAKALQKYMGEHGVKKAIEQYSMIHNEDIVSRILLAYNEWKPIQK